MSRSKRTTIAKETVRICEDGYYALPDGKRVSIAEEMKNSLSATRFIAEKDWAAILEHSQSVAGSQPFQNTVYKVGNCTTIAGAKWLSASGSKVLALNFASAKNPGGGFLNGSQAQEESLARASGLYPALLKCREYYDLHRLNESCLYTHSMILSPDVPVFRDDDDDLVDSPWLCTFLTSPAVNRGCILNNQPALEARIEPVMRERVQRVLALAAVEGYRHLVLGAWGCGVFRNEPAMVAKLFAEALHAKPFRGVFTEVLFAVLSRDEAVLTPFRNLFLNK